VAKVLILKIVENPELNNGTASRENLASSKGGYEVVWEKFGRRAESLARRDPAGGVLLTPCPTTYYTFRDIYP
jgi:hypothetical protein